MRKNKVKKKEIKEYLIKIKAELIREYVKRTTNYDLIPDVKHFPSKSHLAVYHKIHVVLTDGTTLPLWAIHKDTGDIFRLYSLHKTTNQVARKWLKRGNIRDEKPPLLACDNMKTFKNELQYI